MINDDQKINMILKILQTFKKVLPEFIDHVQSINDYCEIYDNFEYIKDPTCEQHYRRIRQESRENIIKIAKEINLTK